MHSKKRNWFARLHVNLIAGVMAGGVLPALAFAADAVPAAPAAQNDPAPAAASQPAPGAPAPPPVDPGPPPNYQGPAPGYPGQPPPPGYQPAPPLVHQRPDGEDPELNGIAPSPFPPIPPAVDGRRQASPRPKTPPYLITSTRPPTNQPSIQAESPDSATAAMKRLNANGPAAQKSGTEELIRRARTNVNFYELVDEMLDEVVYQLGKQDAIALSPLAIRLVRLSPELRPEFAGTLEARLLARIAQATTIRTAVCIECTSMRSRVENGQWLVTLGAVRQEDLQRIGRAQGIKTFVDLGFTFNPQSNVIWMEAVAFRASDGGVVWSDSYRSNATTAMLLRTGRRIPSRSERLDELEHKLQGRPFFGYMVGVGLARLGYNGPTGDIMGPLMTVRIHERFGEDQQQLFGLSVGIFFTGVPQAGKNVLNSLMSGAYYSINLSEPSLNLPELWFYSELGGMFSGNQGNTFYGEAGLDLHVKWRFSLVGGLQYLMPTHFADHDLGGLGYRLRLAMNW
jgi:hypothetical protein